MARGLLGKGRFEYRVGVFNGARGNPTLMSVPGVDDTGAAITYLRPTDRGTRTTSPLPRPRDLQRLRRRGRPAWAASSSTVCTSRRRTGSSSPTRRSWRSARHRRVARQHRDHGPAPTTAGATQEVESTKLLGSRGRRVLGHPHRHGQDQGLQRPGGRLLLQQRRRHADDGPRGRGDMGFRVNKIQPLVTADLFNVETTPSWTTLACTAGSTTGSCPRPLPEGPGRRGQGAYDLTTVTDDSRTPACSCLRSPCRPRSCSELCRCAARSRLTWGPVAAPPLYRARKRREWRLRQEYPWPSSCPRRNSRSEEGQLFRAAHLHLHRPDAAPARAVHREGQPVYDPAEYDAAIFLELAPAMEIHRMIDLALRARGFASGPSSRSATSD